MADRRFFHNHGPFTVAEIATVAGAVVDNDLHASKLLQDVAPLDTATSDHLSFFDNPKYREQFFQSKAGVCFVKPQYADKIPSGMIPLFTPNPYGCYALTSALFYPHQTTTAHISAHAIVDKTAHIGEHVHIAAGAVIGANAIIGAHSSIGANTVIGDHVTIGEHCTIDSLCSISHSIIADHVIIHRGANIGQDGFGFAIGAHGHIKVPQLGRVLIGAHVEIGANTTIDRGAGPDTVIGEGTKIDNLVQIGHNVHIGKHCIIVAQVGISGSTTIGDATIIGGQVGIAGHLKVGSNVRIAAQSGVMHAVPDGASYGGAPAIPSLEWHRQTVAIAKLTKEKRGSNE